MHAIAFDHVKLQVPADEFDAVIGFYEATLGLPIEGRDRFNRGDKPFVSARIAADSVIHIEPVVGSPAMADRPVDHLALRMDASITEIVAHCEAAGVPIERRLDALGAVGEAPAVYIRDPTGMRVELKATVQSG